MSNRRLTLRLEDEHEGDKLSIAYLMSEEELLHPTDPGAHILRIIKMLNMQLDQAILFKEQKDE